MRGSSASARDRGALLRAAGSLFGVINSNPLRSPPVTHDIDESVFMASRVVVMSARPGRIKLDHRVDLPHPRHYAMKTTPAFAALKAELTECVRAEVLAAQAQQQRA